MCYNQLKWKYNKVIPHSGVEITSQCALQIQYVYIYSGGVTYRDKQMIKPRLDLLYRFLLSVLCILLHWRILKWNMTDVLNNEASIRTCNNCEQKAQSPWMLGFKQLFPNLSALWCQRGRIFLRPQSPRPTDELATPWQSWVTGKKCVSSDRVVSNFTWLHFCGCWIKTLLVKAAHP